MKTLFRITVMTPTENIERGVWADGYRFSNEGVITFFNLSEDVGGRPVGLYPVDKIFITSMQSEEEYNASKANKVNTLRSM